MRFNQTEIIEEMEGIIRKSGGAWGEWCVGTAKDTHAPFFQRHLAEDLNDGLAYREGFTSNTADAVVAHLVHARGGMGTEHYVPSFRNFRVSILGFTPEKGDAVGTVITGRPPSGPVRAALPHTVLVLDSWRRNSAHPASSLGHAFPDPSLTRAR